jgi:NAD+ synthase (glutamine-hydrolysing)
MALADDDNYRERRYFTPWTKAKQLEDFTLPLFVQEVTGQVN